jgi:hypothetical protein
VSASVCVAVQANAGLKKQTFLWYDTQPLIDDVDVVLNKQTGEPILRLSSESEPIESDTPLTKQSANTPAAAAAAASAAAAAAAASSTGQQTRPASTRTEL